MRHAALRQIMHSKDRQALLRCKGEAGTDTQSSSEVWCAPADHCMARQMHLFRHEAGQAHALDAPVWGWCIPVDLARQGQHAAWPCHSSCRSECGRRRTAPQMPGLQWYTMSHPLASHTLTSHRLRMCTRCNGAQAAEHVQKAAPSDNCITSAHRYMNRRFMGLRPMARRQASTRNWPVLGT